MKRIGTHRFWLAGMLWLALAATGLGQSYQVTTSYDLNGSNGNFLFVNVFVSTTSGSVSIGSTNIVLNLDPRCLDLAAAVQDPAVAGAWTSTTAPANTYSDVFVSGTVLSATSGRININLVQNNPVPVSTTTSPQLNTTPVRIARVRIPIRDCNCTNPTVTVSPLTVLTPLAEIGQPLPAPLTNASGALANYRLRPSIAAVQADGFDPRICSPSTRDYTTGVDPAIWSVRSTIGTTVTATSPSTSAQLNFQVPNTNSVDTLIALDALGGCADIRFIQVEGPPNVGFGLRVSDGRVNRCATGTPVTLIQGGYQQGVQYYLRENGTRIQGPVNPPVSGQMTWTVTQPTTPGIFTYTIDAEYVTGANACLRTQVSGLTIVTFNCTLTPTITPLGSPSLCSGTTYNLTGTYSSPVPNVALGQSRVLVWSSTNPLVSFPNGNTGTNVTIQTGTTNTATPVDILLTEFFFDPSTTGLGLTTGVSTPYSVTVNALNAPVITGPSTVNWTGGIATRVFNIPGATTVGVSPSLVVNQSGSDYSIQFNAPGTYTITATQVTGSCTGVSTKVVQVTNNCDANPGTIGPAQSVCIGQPTVVYVQNEPLSSPLSTDLQWERFNGTNWVDATGIGARSQVHLTDPINATQRYRLRATGGGGCTVYSAEVVLTPAARTFAGVVTPSDTSICRNGVVTLRALGGLGTLRWQQSTNGLTWQDAIGTGNNTSTFTSITLADSTYFRARFANACDTTYATVLVKVTDEPLATFTALTPTSTPNNTVCLAFPPPTGGSITYNQSALLPGTADLGVGAYLVADPAASGTIALVGSNPVRYRYDAAPADTNLSRVLLAYVVTNGSCTPDVNYQELELINRVRVNLTPIPTSEQRLCAGSTTVNLEATLSNSAVTGTWIAAYVNDINATGTNLAGGSFTPNANSRTVRYVSSSALDRGRTIYFFYRVTTNCGPAAHGAPIVIEFTPETINGTFAALPISICYANNQFIENLDVTADNVVEGELLTNGIAANLTIVNSTATSRRYRYLLAPQDIGRQLEFTWRVRSGACRPLEIVRTIQVLSPPSSTVSERFITMCSNEVRLVQGNAINGTGTWEAVVQPGFGDPGPVNGGTWLVTGSNNSTLQFTGSATVRNQRFKFYFRSSGATTVCSSALDSTIITVTAPPVGNFLPLATPSICAGALSETLRADLAGTPAGFATGRWRTPNGGGTFTDTTAFNTIYNSDVRDGGKGIILEWVITSPGCGSDTLRRTLTVLSTQTNGEFPPQPPTNPLNTLTPICITGDTGPLNATAITLPGDTTRGRWETNGAGQFVTATGTPAALNDGTARYRPARADVGQTIQIRWVLTKGSGACATATIIRPLNVRDTVGASFPQPGLICYPNGSDTLRGVKSGDPLAVGTWSAAPLTATSYTPAGGFTNNTDPLARYIPSINDVGNTFNIRWSVSNGICAGKEISRPVRVTGENLITYTTYIIRNGAPDLTTARGSGIRPVCVGDTVMVVSDGATSYIFSAIGSITQDGNNNDTVLVRMPTSAVTYTVSATAIAGECNFRTNLIFNVRSGSPLALVRLDGNINDQVCAGSQVTLQIQPLSSIASPNNILWQQNRAGIIEPVPLTDISSQTANTVTLFPRPNVRYIARVLTTNGCFSEPDNLFTVQNNQLPVWQVPPICLTSPDGVGDTVVVRPPNVSNAPGVIARWYLAPRSALPNPPPAELPSFVGSGVRLDLPMNDPRINRTGENILTLYYNDGTCANFTSDTFLVQPKPNARFSVAPQLRDAQDNIDLTAIQNAYQPEATVQLPFFERTAWFRYDGSLPIQTYLWDFGDPDSRQRNNSAARDTTHEFSGSGNYPVILYIVSPTGCTDLLVKPQAVLVREEDYNFPNAFTPNSDGQNDVFRPLPTAFDAATNQRITRANVRRMQIFDRWGTLVYESADRNGWNGTTQSGTGGQPFEGGTYTYRVEILLESGRTRTYTGYVNLIR